MTNPAEKNRRKVQRMVDRMPKPIRDVIGGPGWLQDWESAKDARDDERTFVTTYCNRSHRLSDGAPVAHECQALPPDALAAERAGDFDSAARLMIVAGINTPRMLTAEDATALRDGFKKDWPAFAELVEKKR
jgi:hypothetical protein